MGDIYLRNRGISISLCSTSYDFQNCVKRNFKYVLILWNQNKTFMIYKTCFIAFWKKEVMLTHPVFSIERAPAYNFNKAQVSSTCKCISFTRREITRKFIEIMASIIKISIYFTHPDHANCNIPASGYKIWISKLC